MIYLSLADLRAPAPERQIVLPLKAGKHGMPRYFFNIRDGRDIFDTEGTELAGMKEIRFHMVITATALIEAEGAELRNSGNWRMEAVDERGKIVCMMSFGDQ